MLQCASRAQPQASTCHMQLSCHTHYLHAHDFASAAMHNSGLLQMCCSVLRRVAACCSVHVICTHVILRLLLYITQGCWKCVAVCCSVLQCGHVLPCVAVCCSVHITCTHMISCVAGCCSVWQYIAVCVDTSCCIYCHKYLIHIICSVLRAVAACCWLLQCVVVSCNVC